jgi:DNA-binding NarL/FixJ family response regulator
MAAVESMLSEQEIRSAWVMGHNLSLAEAITEVQAMSPPGAAGEDIDRSTVRLSAREEEVLRMLVEGYSDRAIAEALFLSVRTVEAHVTRIRIKLGVRSRTAAVTAAIISGLVDPNPSPDE